MLARLHLKCDDSDSAEGALQRANKALNSTNSSSSRSSSSSASSSKQVVGLGEEAVTADDIDCEKGWCALAAGQVHTANEQFMAVLTRTNEVNYTCLLHYSNTHSALQCTCNSYWLRTRVCSWSAFAVVYRKSFLSYCLYTLPLLYAMCTVCTRSCNSDVQELDQ
jgi:hypothetical protein